MIKFPPSLSLAHLPTPIENLKRFSADCGGVKLLVKRDDLTGASLTGNKIRKLEFFAKAALDTGCDTLITCGGIQSNHARATAIVAAKLGLDSYLVLRGESGLAEANLLLDKLVGANVRFISRQEYFYVNDIMRELSIGLAHQGHRAYVIAEGGSEPLGCFGYIKAVSEIKDQLDTMGQVIDYIVCPVGSGGTLAGLLLGVQLYNLKSKVIGINVCSTAKHHTKRVAAIIRQATCEFDLKVDFNSAQIDIIDGYVGDGYARSRIEELAFIRKAACTEGLILDPVYTGKAMYGLYNEIKKGRFSEQDNILFIHTGGIFGVFPQRLQDMWRQVF